MWTFFTILIIKQISTIEENKYNMNQNVHNLFNTKYCYTHLDYIQISHKMFKGLK